MMVGFGFGSRFDQKNLMKLKLTLITAVLTMFSLSVLSQDSKDVNKRKEIKNDPAKYIEEGGVLPETKEMPLDSKEKIPEFIIHRTENGIEESKEKNLESLKLLNQIEDQTSSEYLRLKETWILQNQSFYQKCNPEIRDDQTKPIEERKLENNSEQ